MKKLMIAAAIVCAAVVSQAASVSWTCTLVKNGSAEQSNTGIAYLMLGNGADFTALAGKGATAVNAALEDALISYTPSTAGKYTHDAVDNATLKLEDGTNYGGAYLVIFDTTTVTDASKFYVTAEKTLLTLEGDKIASLSFGSQAGNSKLDSNWNAVAAPEPTSGLLLLLGMAGLALRRRRA